MQVHIIYNPNRWLHNGKAGQAEVRVHRAGCRDIAREVRGSTSDYATAVASQEEAAQDFWADFIQEESMTEEDAMSYTDFMPCTDGLPVSATVHAGDCGLQGSGLNKRCTCHVEVKKTSEPNPTADRLAAQYNRTSERIAELAEKLEWLRKKQSRQYDAAMAALHEGQFMSHDNDPDTGAKRIAVVY